MTWIVSEGGLCKRILMILESEIPRRVRSRVGALCRFVVNCAPNLRKLGGISFRASEEGCAELWHTCREIESKFRTILCKYSQTSDLKTFQMKLCLLKPYKECEFTLIAIALSWPGPLIPSCLRLCFRSYLMLFLFPPLKLLRQTERCLIDETLQGQIVLWK